ncbi:MAG: peptidylprolyl isomerase [Proteobacteria bacterium]|nr:peptidylprolyl isomerase [Pseudomonadota bacterium]
MNQNMTKILAFIAVLGGLGGAYYVMMVKPKQEQVAEAPKAEKPVEEAKKEDVKAEEPKTEASKPAEEVKEEVKAEESKTEETAQKVEYSDDTLAAKIDGVDKKVIIKDVKATMDMLPPQMRQLPFQTLYPILVRQAVDFVLMEQEAIKQGIDKKPEIVKAIADRKRDVLRAAYLEKEVQTKVSEDTLKKKYEEIKKMIPENEKEYEIAHIVVKDEAEAKKLISEIKSGKTTFEKGLEKTLDERSKANGGKIGYIKRMDITPEIFKEIESAKSGDVISTPLTLGKAGSSIFRVVSNRPLQVPEFEKIKDEIRKALLPELSLDIVKAVKADAGLKLFNLEGKEIPERSQEELNNSLKEDAPSTVDASKLADDFTCATYKDGKITLKDLKDAYAALPDMFKMLPFEKIYELVLIRVCNDQIIAKAAEKSGIGSDAKIQEKMKSEAKLVVQEAYLKAKAEAAISETDMKAEYNAIVKNMSEKNEMEYRLRHIAFKTEEEAKAGLKKLKSGESFDKLVESSIDDSTKDKKGELGYVRKNMLPQEIFEPISKTAKGTLVNQVCKLNDNLFSVMRVEDKRPVTPPTFEQLKERIKGALTAKKAALVLEDLRSKFKITYESIKGLPTADEIEKVVKEINVKMTQELGKKGSDVMSDKPIE